jgi:hypothetical protein
MHAPDYTESELIRLHQEVRRLRTVLNRLTPGLETILKRRGFRIYKKKEPPDLLVPAKRHVNGYYEMLHKYSFRLFLRDVIKHQDGFTVEAVTRYATPEVTRGYLAYLLSIKLVRQKGDSYSLVKRPIRSFGGTLEWYIAELLGREFGAEALWGLRFKRRRVGGDYDVIAKLEGALFYGEVKSSPPKQVYDTEIAAFLDRVDDLSPEIAVFVMDTELRMKDKIVPLFEQELARRSQNPPAIVRMERELFHLQNRIFIINAKEDILRNIQAVLSWHYRQASRDQEG